MKTKITDNDIEWAKAVLYYTRRGEVGPLMQLAESDRPIPVIARKFLAEMLSGKVKPPDQRGRSNCKLSWQARKQIEDGLGHVYQNSEIVLCFIEELADKFRLEPIDIRQRMEKARRDAIKTLAHRYDMSESGIRKMANLAAATALGRMFSGTNPSEWEDDQDVCVGARYVGAENAKSAYELALRAVCDPGSVLDPLLPVDPFTV